MNAGEWVVVVLLALGAASLAGLFFAVRGEVRHRRERERRIREAVDRYRQHQENVRRDEALWREGCKKHYEWGIPVEKVPPLRKLSTYREPVPVKSLQDVRAYQYGNPQDKTDWVPAAFAASAVATTFEDSTPSFSGGGGDFGGGGASGSFD